MKIRKATQSDLDQVLRVERRAFGDEKGPEIAGLVKELVQDQSAMPILSLLAFDEEPRAVGHILFTRAHVEPEKDSPATAILAPLAVVPEAQSCGVGGCLIKEGIRRLSGAGVELVFVLGHPAYYPRHGFMPAGALGFEATYPIPEKDADAWMVQALRPGVIGSVSGKVICADALNRPEHWRE